MPKSKIHSPVLENAAEHGHGPGDVALSQLKVGDCVGVMAPGDAPHQIMVRVTVIEKTRCRPEDLMVKIPEILVGQIESDQSWGAFFRAGDPAYRAGAFIRFAAENIARVY